MTPCYRDDSILSSDRQLTKRELFAAMAMQGMTAYYGINLADKWMEEAIRRAVLQADALIEELNKPTETE